MKAREFVVFIISVVAVFLLTTYALAGPGAGGTGPGGGCAAATFSSPGCVTLAQIPGSDGGTASAASYTVTGTAPQWICSLATATCEIDSPTNDATTSGTVGAFTLKATVNIADADLIFDLQTSAGAHSFTVTENGNIAAPGLTNTMGRLQVNGSGSSSYSVASIGNGTNGAFHGQNATAASPVFTGAQDGVGTTMQIRADGVLDLPTAGATTCTLNGASPSTCTATVVAASICTCSPVGATAAIAAGGCALGLSGTTLTVTGPNAGNWVVNIHCHL
jgi:hypothetical protein